MSYKQKPLLSRLMKWVKKDIETECWNWNGNKYLNGYGQLTVNKKKFAAHRLSYSLFIGELIGGLYICHKCDNPSCVSPFHLFQGTPTENVKDAVSKNRKPNPQHPSEYHYRRLKCRCQDCKDIFKSYNKKCLINSIAKKQAILTANSQTTATTITHAPDAPVQDMPVNTNTTNG